MSIKPIDFQVMMPKTSEVAKLHNDEQQRNQAMQQQQANSTQSTAENNLRQVHSQLNSQKAAIREKNEKNNENKKKKKKNGTYSKDRTVDGEEKNCTIDIRL